MREILAHPRGFGAGVRAVETVERSLERHGTPVSRLCSAAPPVSGCLERLTAPEPANCDAIGPALSPRMGYKD